MQVTYADSTVDWIFYVSFHKKYGGSLILSLRLLQVFFSIKRSIRLEN